MAVEGAIAAPAASREANTAALVRRLVRSTLASRGVRADDSERATERLYRYAVRLVGSCLATSVEPDEGATADAIKRKLTREGSATAAVKFAELHRRLAQQPGLKARWATLHALLRVSEDRRAEDRAVVPAGGGIGAGAATARHIADPLSSAAAAGGLPRPRRPGSRQISRRGRRIDARARPPGCARARLPRARRRGGDQPGDRRAGARARRALRVPGHRRPTHQVQPADGFVRRRSRRAGEAGREGPGEETHGARLALPTRPRRARRRGRGGRRRRRRHSRRDVHSWRDAEPRKHRGLGRRRRKRAAGVSRAAVQAELADYYRLIAVLEAQAQVPMASALEAPTTGSGGGTAGGGTYLTLRRLSVWLAEPLRRLRLLAVLVDAAADARGGALLRALHEHAKHGDPATRATVERLLAAAANRRRRMVRAWVVAGSWRDRGASSSSRRTRRSGRRTCSDLGTSSTTR